MFNVDLYDYEVVFLVLDDEVFYVCCCVLLVDGGLMMVNLFGCNVSFMCSVVWIVWVFGSD